MVVQQLRLVFGEAPPVSRICSRFCIGFELGRGLSNMIELEGLTGGTVKVIIEYNAYKKICCSIYLNTGHIEDKCPAKEAFFYQLRFHPR
jgi:hypothetical protein